MNQGPRRISFMEKKEGQKSRGTIPLNKAKNANVGTLIINLLFKF